MTKIDYLRKIFKILSESADLWVLNETYRFVKNMTRK